MAEVEFTQNKTHSLLDFLSVFQQVIMATPTEQFLAQAVNRQLSPHS